MKKIFIFHPFLFAVFPVLFFYSKNMRLFLPRGPVIAAIAILLLAVGLFYFSKLFIKDVHKNAFLSSLFIFLFFSAGPTVDTLKDFGRVINVEVRTTYVLGALILVLLGAAYFVARTSLSFKSVTKFLNYSSFTLVALSLFAMGKSYNFQAFFSRPDVSSDPYVVSENALIEGKELLPDIYYIILDGYSNEKTLKESLGYSNEAFYQFLEDRGFFIARKTTSNYPATSLSIASSLNMQYLHDSSLNIDGEDLYKYSAGLRNSLMENSRLQRFLASRGYLFATIVSGYGPTIFESADYSLTGKHLIDSVFFRDDFLLTFVYQMSALRPLFDVNPHLNTPQAGRTLYTFEKLKEIQNLRTTRPLFVFAHVIAPHLPYVLNENCEKVKGWESAGSAKLDAPFYVKQLICVNKMTEETVGAILSKSQTPPIIVLQSDHGWHATLEEPPEETIESVSMIPEQYVRERMRNFAAFYLPGDGEKIMYDSVTPVNIFRLILNHYFKTQYPILDDRNYYTQEDNLNGRFFEVTRIVSFD